MLTARTTRMRSIRRAKGSPLRETGKTPRAALDWFLVSMTAVHFDARAQVLITRASLAVDVEYT
jgi:hypothetical protein